MQGARVSEHARAAAGPREARAEGELAVTQVAGAVMPAACRIPPPRPRGAGDFLYYGLRNRKLVFGLSLELLFVLFAIIGPFISPHDTTEFFLPAPATLGTAFWLGTDYFGHDVFAQLVNGLRLSYLVGALGALCAALVGMALGFIAGWRGGLLDEVLQMLTNIMVMIPVAGAARRDRLLPEDPRSVLFEGVFIGLTTWPWVARAVRAQTFTLRSREFVDLARLSGKRPPVDRRPGHRAEHGVVPVPRRHPAVRQLHAARGQLRLPRARPDQRRLARHDDEPGACSGARCIYHMWWWFIPPGAGAHRAWSPRC